VGDIPSEFSVGEHEKIFSVILLDGTSAYWTVNGADVMNTLIIRDDMDLPDCTAQPAPTVDIPITLASDCAFIETKDYLNGAFTGHWSTVQSDDVPVLLHYGQDLIGSVHQSANSADYRAVATPCF
jgi:hypothetical protein